MTAAISSTMLSQLSEFIAREMGLHFPTGRWADLERGIRSAAREFDFEDVGVCIEWLLSSRPVREKVEILASHLTIGETYFFREKKIFEALGESILPELIRSRRGSEQRLRIWSAGCATGEEPYSIAILLSKMMTDLKDWNITILATDINPRFLKKASEGLYNEWSFRDCPRWVQEKYFQKAKDHRLEIMPYIKKMVAFSHHNLAEDPYPALLNNTNAMDIIFCRNVLMYFAQDQVNKVVRGFYDCLIDGGGLIVSPTEASHVLYPQFTAVNFPGATLYRKEVAKFKMQDTSCKLQDSSFQREKTPSPEPKFQDLLSYPEKEKIEDEYRISFPASKSRAPIPDSKPSVSDLYREALTLYEKGRYIEAEEKVIALPSHDRTESRAMALLARIYANQGKLHEAGDCCRKALTEDKLNPSYYYLLSTILQEQNQLEEAASSLKRTLYANPDYVLAHFALGNLSLRQMKFQESHKHFENALSLLCTYKPEEILPESEGMTAGRLIEIIRSTVYMEPSS
jgi:chemotaxis protein methyltransferase CheR